MHLNFRKTLLRKVADAQLRKQKTKTKFSLVFFTVFGTMFIEKLMKLAMNKKHHESFKDWSVVLTNGSDMCPEES